MTREALLNRIWIDPGRCGGKPCIRGRRIWVSLVLDRLALGETPQQIMNDLDLQLEDVQACIAFASEATRERYVDIPLEQTA